MTSAAMVLMLVWDHAIRREYPARVLAPSLCWMKVGAHRATWADMLEAR